MKKRIIDHLNTLRNTWVTSKEFAEFKLKRFSSEDVSSEGNSNIIKDHTEYSNQLDIATSNIKDVDECIDWLNKQV